MPLKHVTYAGNKNYRRSSRAWLDRAVVHECAGDQDYGTTWRQYEVAQDALAEGDTERAVFHLGWVGSRREDGGQV